MQNNQILVCMLVDEYGSPPVTLPRSGKKWWWSQGKIKLLQKSCIQEEADTILFLHAMEAIMIYSTTLQIFSPDTDVFILAIHFCPHPPRNAADCV